MPRNALIFALGLTLTAFVAVPRGHGLYVQHVGKRHRRERQRAGIDRRYCR